jgi:hypothetical protein
MDDAQIEEIRCLLKPPPTCPFSTKYKMPVHFGVAYAMRQWERLVREQVPAERATDYMPDSEVGPLAAELAGHKRVRPTGPERPLRGRPRSDEARQAAMMLAAIFHSFTGEEPTRNEPVRDHGQSAARSHFYKFADASFSAVGLPAQDIVLRETTECWKTLSKRLRHNEIELIFKALDLKSKNSAKSPKVVK